MYGNSFTSMWANTDVVEVKRIWADRLGGFNSMNIADALSMLDDKPYPPNLPEFVSLCRLSLRKKESPVSTRQEAAKAIKNIKDKVGAWEWKEPGKRDWAEKIKFKHELGDRLLPIQVAMAYEALK